MLLALYSSSSTNILTPGFLSEPLRITNGTRQGGLLSPLIFAMVMEPLAEAIRQSDLITGIDIVLTK